MDLIKIRKDGDATGNYWRNLSDYETEAQNKNSEKIETREPEPEKKAPKTKKTTETKQTTKGRRKNAV